MVQSPIIKGYNAFFSAKAYLMKQIGHGRWTVGQYLPTEFELANELGVSRTIVREVVKVLQSQGVLEILRSKGTRINDPEQWDLLDADVWGAALSLNPELAADLFEVRELVEMKIVESASMKSTPQEISQLDYLMEEMKNSLVNLDKETYFVLDSEFHKTITNIADNAVMKRLYSTIRKIMNHTLEPSLSITLHTSEDLERSFKQHASIVDAIRSHDSKAAVMAMTEHLRDYENDVKHLRET